MTDSDFRAALKQLADAVDGWKIEAATDDPLAIAMDHARKLLQTAEMDERLSSGKLVSERLDELFAEVEQRDLEPAEVILDSRAFQLYCGDEPLIAWWCDGGRWISDNLQQYHPGEYENPTHWQPLPSPPPITP